MNSYPEILKVIANHTLRLSDILKEKENEPLFVINTSDLQHVLGKERRQERGEIYLSIENANKSDISIRILDTWIPIDLTSFAPRIDILNSSIFRGLINGERITVVSNEFAKSILETEEARAEQRSHRIISNNINVTPTNNNRPTLSAPTNTPSGMTNQDMSGINVSPKVVNIMGRSDLTTVEVITALRNIQSELKEADFVYIVSNAQGPDSNKLTGWVNTIR